MLFMLLNVFIPIYGDNRKNIPLSNVFVVETARGFQINQKSRGGKILRVYIYRDIKIYRYRDIGKWGFRLIDLRQADTGDKWRAEQEEWSEKKSSGSIKVEQSGDGDSRAGKAQMRGTIIDDQSGLKESGYEK